MVCVGWWGARSRDLAAAPSCRSDIPPSSHLNGELRAGYQGKSEASPTTGQSTRRVCVCKRALSWRTETVSRIVARLVTMLQLPQISGISWVCVCVCVGEFSGSATQTGFSTLDLFQREDGAKYSRGQPVLSRCVFFGGKNRQGPARFLYGTK